MSKASESLQRALIYLHPRLHWKIETDPKKENIFTIIECGNIFNSVTLRHMYNYTVNFNDNSVEVCAYNSHLSKYDVVTFKLECDFESACQKLLPLLKRSLKDCAKEDVLNELIEAKVNKILKGK